MSYCYFLLDKSNLFKRIQNLRIIPYHNNSAICKLVHSFQCNNCLFRTRPTSFTNIHFRSHKYRNQILVKRYCNTNQQHNQVKKLKKSEVLRLLTLAKPEKWKILTAVSLLFVSSAVTMAVPYSLGKVLDIIYSGTDTPVEAKKKLNQFCAVLVGVFLVGGLCNFGRIYIISCAGYRVTQQLRKRVFSAVMKQEQSWFDKKSTGELVNRLSADTQLVGQALSGNVSDGLRSTFSVLAGSCMMVYTSPELATVGLSVVPPVAILAVVYGRFVRNITKAVQDGLADASNVADERISNIRTVKMFGRETNEVENYGNRMEHVLQLGYKESLARAGFYGAAGLTGNTIIIGVLYYGGAMIGDQSLSVGALSAFLMYAAYIGVSVGGLTRFYTELNRSIGAATRLWELIDRKPTIPARGGIVPSTRPEGRITFNNVRFEYNAGQPVLDNVQLDIRPGQTVAVVGPSGSGKSTLGSLLLRLYEPTRGAVLLDNTSVSLLDPLWLKANIGAVGQEPILFACSIRDNILYGSDDPSRVTEQDLHEAITEANLAEFLDSLPQGLDTMVGERGLTLSGGQRQRVAIARALVKRPNILLLDEATSALDAKSEYLVRQALERAARGRTVLTIAHRLSTIRNANTIAVLQDGRIVEKGTYEELVTKPDGKFRELVMHQTFRDETE